MAEEAGRRTRLVQITTPTRDQGRTYLLTEMSAPRAEKWAMRAINGLAKAGVDIGNIRPGMGMAALAVLGIDAVFRMPWELGEPLLDEMFECVQFVMDGGQARKLLDGDIEEVATRLQLREEVASLHLGFSIREKLMELKDQLQTVNRALDTPTSVTPSGSSSRRASRRSGTSTT